jgi:hypothetical protein
MIETIRWKPNDRLRFLGRNGTGRCTGIEVFHNDGVVFLRPFTSKNEAGRCEIAVPVTALPQLAAVLHAVKPMNRH